jgi:P-type Ca2+ transporter type 2C
VSCLRRLPKLARAVERRLSEMPGVEGIRVNPDTGSILIHFPRHRGSDDVKAEVDDCVGALLAAFVDGRQHTASSPTSDTGSRVRYALKETGETVCRLKAQDLLSRLQTDDATGLNEADARARLARYGANVLTTYQRRSRMAILLDQVATLPVAILGASAALAIVSGGMVEAIAIAAVVAANAAIGYATEDHVERTVDALAGLPRPPSQVLRDGEAREMPSADVVPGDILILRPGSLVGADARVIESWGLSVDESALTGESLPVSKHAEAMGPEQVPLAERENMVFTDTTVTGGSGLAVVVGTGSHTEIGMIQRLIGETTAPLTGVQAQLGQLGRSLGVASVALCGLVFLASLLRGHGLLATLRSVSALLVAAIPEGLPAVATSTLALGVQKLRRQGVLVRQLEAMETLGAIEVMCLDKTGTLTWNRMTATHIETASASIKIGEGGLPLSETGDGQGAERIEITRLLQIAALCNDASLQTADGGPQGSPTELALLHLVEATGIQPESLRVELPLERTIHRSEGRALMTTVHQEANGNSFMAVKGAPEAVLECCSWYLSGDHRGALDDAIRRRFMTANAQMAGESLRVLGFAFRDGPPSHDGDYSSGDDSKGLTWVGLVALRDPLRDNGAEVIAALHAAGIRPVMITGDQPQVARTIATALNIGNGRRLRVIKPKDAGGPGGQGGGGALAEADVFARASPRDKLKIVQAFQDAGRVVAMTGDGINDGPALRAADVGITLGQSATEVARSVGDLILLRDDLTGILEATALGRTTHENIRKSIRFLISTNLGEMFLVASATALGLPQPLTPIQLLWINLVTDVAPALSLAVEPPEPDIMVRPPPPRERKVLSGRDFPRVVGEATVMTTTALGAYLYGLSRYGPGGRARTLGFTSLVSGQLLHALVCRSDISGIFARRRPQPNLWLATSVFGALGLQAAAFFVPPLRSVLGLTRIGALDAAIVGGAAVLPMLLAEARKPGDGAKTARMAPESSD